MTELQELVRQVHDCTDCQLAEGRNLSVPGEGPPEAKIMFIGEGPGFREDQQGRPFVGPAGQLLEQLLASIGMTRSQVYITNLVKCRPPNNRDPLPAEVAACSKYLDRQIQMINPKVIATLGRHSLAKFLPGTTIGKTHGKAVRMDGFLLYPMYHPAAALHQNSLRQVIEDDFKALGALTKDPLQSEPQRKELPQQLSLL